MNHSEQAPTLHTSSAIWIWRRLLRRQIYVYSFWCTAVGWLKKIRDCRQLYAVLLWLNDTEWGREVGWNEDGVNELLNRKKPKPMSTLPNIRVIILFRQLISGRPYRWIRKKSDDLLSDHHHHQTFTSVFTICGIIWVQK